MPAVPKAKHRFSPRVERDGVVMGIGALPRPMESPHHRWVGARPSVGRASTLPTRPRVAHGDLTRHARRCDGRARHLLRSPDRARCLAAALLATVAAIRIGLARPRGWLHGGRASARDVRRRSDLPAGGGTGVEALLAAAALWVLDEQRSQSVDHAQQIANPLTPLVHQRRL